MRTISMNVIAMLSSVIHSQGQNMVEMKNKVLLGEWKDTAEGIR